MVLWRIAAHARDRCSRRAQQEDRSTPCPCEPDPQPGQPHATLARHGSHRKVPPGEPEIGLPLVELPGAGPRLDVKTPVFEGPLELLLALVEREELDIFQVSLAKVTDAYMAEIAAREVAAPQEMREMVWMAASLLLLKSIRLLPGEPATEEETDLLGWEEDVRRRLEEYRAYKEMAGELMDRVEKDSVAFRPRAPPIEPGGQEEPLEVVPLLGAVICSLAPIPSR